MSEFKTFTFFTVFITLYWLFMVPMGGANDLTNQTFNVTENDLRITPELPDPQYDDVDLNSSFESSNVTVVNTENYFNGSQEYNTEKGIVLQDNKSKGYVSFNVPNAETIRTLTQKESILLDTRTHLWEGNISGSCGSNSRCYPVRAESTIDISDNTNFVTIEFDDDSGLLNTKDPVLYELSSSQSRELGIFETIIEYTGSAYNFFTTLLTLVLKLPVYISIPFGLYLGYILVKIVSFL